MIPAGKLTGSAQLCNPVYSSVPCPTSQTGLLHLASRHYMSVSMPSHVPTQNVLK
jgi:hypothetical protein